MPRRRRRHRRNPHRHPDPDDEPAFREVTKLRIVSLNALKLRVETEPQKMAWQKLFKALADEDAIVLQEIPAGKDLFHRRTSFALEALNTHTTSGRWAMLASEPMEASAADKCTECHVLLYQTRAVEVVKATTLHSSPSCACATHRSRSTSGARATTLCSCPCTCRRIQRSDARTRRPS